jgi:hypothetical protein
MTENEFKDKILYSKELDEQTKKDILLFLYQYINERIGTAVKNICDIVISKYDRQFENDSIALDKLKSDLENLKKDVWVENLT